MQRAFVGFYWTLPVPWAGFRDLPSDVDAAARLSRTIRYQRERVRRWVKDEGGYLVHEAVFLEIAPDRGSDVVAGPFERAAQMCRAQDATLVLVDFSAVQAWRSHGLLQDLARRAGVRIEQLYPDPVLINGKEFDPQQHFEGWRRRQQSWSASKPEREAALLARIAELRGDGSNYAQVADSLNAEGRSTVTGRRWTADGVRKFVRAVTK